MEILRLYKNILDIAITDFKAVVESGEILYSQSMEPWKLRLYLCDSSFMDIYYSVNGKYSYHWDRRLITDKIYRHDWDRRLITDKIYRHDNAPHQKWKDISTFPKHFHNGSEDMVFSSYISDEPEIAVREFLSFAVKNIIKSEYK